jgi:hypothetical protein
MGNEPLQDNGAQVLKEAAIKLTLLYRKFMAIRLIKKFSIFIILQDRLCGLVVRVLGYRSGSPGSIPGTTRKKK